MSNNFLQYAVEITSLTDDELTWVVNELHWKPDEDPEAELPPWWDEEATSLGFDFKIYREGREVLLYAEEHGNVELVAEFIFAFVTKFRPDAIFAVEWAETCDRMKPGEFGGGACLISREGIQWQATSTWVVQESQRIAERRAALARDAMEDQATGEDRNTHITRFLVATVARAYCDGDASAYGDARTLLEDVERDVRAVLDAMPTLDLDRFIARHLDAHAFDLPEETKDGV